MPDKNNYKNGINDFCIESTGGWWKAVDAVSGLPLGESNKSNTSYTYNVQISLR